jgi:hypothetical protein
LFSEKYGYGTARKDSGFKRWYPEQGLSSYEYANTVERWNKLLLQISASKFITRPRQAP